MTERGEPETAGTRERGMLAAFVIAMFVAGPTLGFIGLALPHSAAANDLGLASLALAAYVIAATVALFRNRLPSWGIEAVVTLGTLMISLSIYFSGPVTTTGAFFYLWVVLGSAYFFSRSKVIVQLLIVAAGYALALALKPHAPGMVQAWIVAVGTLTMAAALFVVTREHVERLVGRLAEAADTGRSPGCSTAAASTASSSSSSSAPPGSATTSASYHRRPRPLQARHGRGLYPPLCGGGLDGHTDNSPMPGLTGAEAAIPIWHGIV